jgi:hypothetical protein
MTYSEQINYSGLTFNANDEFYFDGERIIIIGFWTKKDGNIIVNLRRSFPIVHETIEINELFETYGNLLRTRINNTIIGKQKKSCNQYLK